MKGRSTGPEPSVLEGSRRQAADESSLNQYRHDDYGNDGITSLMELHREIGWRCHELQHARFEEGSEHFFAYCFEEVTGRTILHGELVSMGVLIMSSLTGHQPEVARSIVADAGTRHRPEELGITWEEIDATLTALPAFATEGGYWFSYAQTLEVNEQTFLTARAALDF